jgi:hypothetical protein
MPGDDPLGAQPGHPQPELRHVVVGDELRVSANNRP